MSGRGQLATTCGVINRKQMVRKECERPFGHQGDHRDKDGTAWPQCLGEALCPKSECRAAGCVMER